VVGTQIRPRQSGHEVHRLRADVFGGHDQVALVLAVGVIHQDDIRRCGCRHERFDGVKLRFHFGRASVGRGALNASLKTDSLKTDGPRGRCIPKLSAARTAAPLGARRPRRGSRTLAGCRPRTWPSRPEMVSRAGSAAAWRRLGAVAVWRYLHPCARCSEGGDHSFATGLPGGFEILAAWSCSRAPGGRPSTAATRSWPSSRRRVPLDGAV